jgi:hypothetical protein
MHPGFEAAACHAPCIPVLKQQHAHAAAMLAAAAALLLAAAVRQPVAAASSSSGNQQQPAASSSSSHHALRSIHTGSFMHACPLMLMRACARRAYCKKCWVHLVP